MKLLIVLVCCWRCFCDLYFYVRLLFFCSWLCVQSNNDHIVLVPPASPVAACSASSHTHTNTCNCVSVCVCVAEHKPRAEAVHQNSFACLKTSGSGLSVSSWTRRCVFQCVLEKELAKAVENVRARDDDVGRAEKNKLLPENLFTALTKLSLSLCLLSSARAKTFCF